jgi:hypothetical protein
MEFYFAIVGDFAMYVSGVLSSPPHFITIYMVYNPQNVLHQINVLLQIDSTAAL